MKAVVVPARAEAIAVEFKCDKCNKICTSKSGLTNHQNACSGEKIEKKTIPKPVRNTVWETQFPNLLTGTCYCCKKGIKYSEQWDCGHIKSSADGGQIIADNLRPLCQTCNRSMGAKNMHDFMKEHGYAIPDDIAKRQLDTGANKLMNDFEILYDDLCATIRELDQSLARWFVSFILTNMDNLGSFNNTKFHDIFALDKMMAADKRLLESYRPILMNDEAQQKAFSIYVDRLRMGLSSDKLPKTATKNTLNMQLVRLLNKLQKNDKKCRLFMHLIEYNVHINANEKTINTLVDNFSYIWNNERVINDHNFGQFDNAHALLYEIAITLL